MILCLWGVGGREGVRLVKVYGGGECMCVFVHVCVCVFVVFSPADLDHHTAVKKCLWYTLSSIEHQQALSKWDQGDLE